MSLTTSGQTTSRSSVLSGPGSASGSAISIAGASDNGNYVGKYGYKMPQMNLYQKDYEGTSNVYSPYIYYNQDNQDKQEKFAAVNEYDDKYCKY